MKRKILIILNLILFLLVLGIYLIKKEFVIDSIIYNAIISFKSDILTDIMKIITFLASTKFIIFIMIILLILSLFKYKIPFIIDIVILGEVIINRIIKLIVKRDRPIGINLVTEKYYSFPSGHTMVSVVFYGFLIYLIYKTNMNKYLKVSLIVLLSLLILLVMVSRIYLGVHYFTDCIGGLFISFAYLLIAISVLERNQII